MLINANSNTNRTRLLIDEYIKLLEKDGFAKEGKENYLLGAEIRKEIKITIVFTTKEQEDISKEQCGNNEDT